MGRRMPRRRNQPPHDPYRLVKYVLISALDGVAAGWTFLLILLWLDIGGLGHLVHGSESGVTALIVLLLSFGVTFSLVGLGWRIMVLLPDED
jgi:hypothetical protein